MQTIIHNKRNLQEEECKSQRSLAASAPCFASRPSHEACLFELVAFNEDGGQSCGNCRVQKDTFWNAAESGHTAAERLSWRTRMKQGCTIAARLCRAKAVSVSLPGRRGHKPPLPAVILSGLPTQSASAVAHSTIKNTPDCAPGKGLEHTMRPEANMEQSQLQKQVSSAWQHCSRPQLARPHAIQTRFGQRS